MLASVYTDDNERGIAMGVALGGLAMGVLSKSCKCVSLSAMFVTTVLHIVLVCERLYVKEERKRVTCV